MPKKISLTVENDELQALQGAFGDGTPKSLPDNKLEALAQLAFQAWSDCFCGRKKYRSLTEQHLEWLTQVYRTILVDEEPSERRLFLNFHFSYGQAQYLSRVVRQQGIPTWRVKALKALETALKKRADEADTWIGEGRGVDRMIFILPKSCRIELEAVYGTLLDGGTAGLSPYRTEGSMGTYVSLAICADDLKPVLKQVTKSLENLA